MNPRWQKSAIVLLGFIVCDTAAAHSRAEGVINLYLGMLHPFYSISAILGLLGLGSILGRLDAEKKPAFLTFGYCILILATLFITLFYDLVFPGASLVYLVLIQGLLIAFDKRLPQIFNYFLAAVCAILLSVAIKPDAETFKDNILLALGTWFSLSVTTLLIIDTVERIKHEWQMIALRAIGAWLAAYGVLMTSLQFQK